MLHIAMLARTLLFRRFSDTNVYGTGSVKMWIGKLAASKIRVYTDIFTVYSKASELVRTLVQHCS